MLCIGLLAFMGITAIQKSMTLNLGFQSSPKVLCELQVDGVSIFDNTTKEVAEYVTLSGNTLTFDKDRHTSVFGAETFQLTLKNYAQTESQLLVNFENATVNGGNEVFILDNLAHTFTVTPTENIVSISMTRVLKVDIEKTGVVLSNSNLTNISGDSYYLNLDEENSLSATFNLASGYKEPISISATTSKGEYSSASGSIIIPSENLGTGNISIRANAVANIASISYGTMTNCSSSVNTPTIQIGEPYETTLTAETGYIFDETSVTVAGNSYTWEVDANDKTKGTLTISNVQSDFTINANARYPRLKVVYKGEGASADGLSARNPDYGYEMKVVSNYVAGDGVYGFVTYSGEGNDLGQQPSKGYEIPYNTTCSIFSSDYFSYYTHYFYRITSYETEFSSITSTPSGAYCTFTMPSYDIFIDIVLQGWSVTVCFVAGTQVYTETGYKNIEDIQNGDMVWSYNETTQEFELKEVYDTYIRYSYTEIITIGIGDTEITATYNHRFLTQNRGWITIKEITTDDWLISEDGVYQISSYKSEMTTDYFYNLNVQDNHNYLVSDKNIVVHNDY